MNVEIVKTGFLAENTYILYDASSDAVVIDPGDEYHKIKSKLDELNLVCRFVLLTHGHFDHINEAAAFQKDGALVFIHYLDVHLIYDQKMTNKLKYAKSAAFEPDVLLFGGEALSLAGMGIKVIHTPGHSAGSVCFIAGVNLFTGDTLFLLDVGRTDFPTGSEDALMDSIKNKLFTLDFDYAVRPGHGDMSTLFYEIKNNPYAK